MTPTLLLTRAALVAALAGTASCDGHQHTAGGDCQPDLTPVAGQHVRGCLTAADQSSDGSSVTVTAVDILGAAGWIVLHTDDHGEAGPRIGVIAIPQGRSYRVTVPPAARFRAAAAAWRARRRGR